MTTIQLITHTCNILTCNVRGIMSSAGSLSHLLDKHRIDISIVTEHKLMQKSQRFRDTIHAKNTAHSICETEVTPLSRCGKGGVGILLKKTLCFSTKNISLTEHKNICRIKLCTQNSLPIFVFAVYSCICRL